eukprot:m.256422 g.256422  ORF g.256422 m.256422 type:complete len:144 (+) comp34366_c0_seq1:300-731(+)
MSLDESRINWGRIPRDEAVTELASQPEGTFLLRMSQTDNETYSISVVQDAQVRHIRVISGAGGFQINKADDPCKTIYDLLKQKMGEKIKSKLSGKETKETTLLVSPLYVPEDDDDDGGMDMGALLSKRGPPTMEAASDDDDDL